MTNVVQIVDATVTIPCHNVDKKEPNVVTTVITTLTIPCQIVIAIPINGPKTVWN